MVTILGKEFSKNDLNFILWCTYIAHYACATADTWASEVGILSTSNPRLVTTLFLREVPPGTNGGMSLLGTIASGAGGAFIGLIYFLTSFYYNSNGTHSNSSSNVEISQIYMVLFGFICGILGSLLDSLLGATCQSSHYSTNRKCIVKHYNNATNAKDNSIIHICGYDILSNEAVNFVSILFTMILSVIVGSIIYCNFQSAFCNLTNY